MLGPHAAFIVGAYLVAAVVIVALIAWVVIDGRLQRRALARLDGLRRAGAGRLEPA